VVADSPAAPRLCAHADSRRSSVDFGRQLRRLTQGLEVRLERNLGVHGRLVAPEAEGGWTGARPREESSFLHGTAQQLWSREHWQPMASAQGANQRGGGRSASATAESAGLLTESDSEGEIGMAVGYSEGKKKGMTCGIPRSASRFCLLDAGATRQRVSRATVSRAQWSVSQQRAQAHVVGSNTSG
jgi:hypothetical protein